jgi:threonine dehydratase
MYYMTTTARRRVRTPGERRPGDAARRALDRFRPSVDDHFTVNSLADEMPSVAADIGEEVLCMRTDDNIVGAFKWRGAGVAARELSWQGAEGFITPSAGNAARGAAIAARVLRMRMTAVVPRTAPRAKTDGILDLYPEVELIIGGDTFDDCARSAQQLSQERGMPLLHPYDHPDVIAGQGTIIDDLIENCGSVPPHLVVPVGGGGLVAGLAQRLTELGRSDVTIHAVEAPGSNSMSRSLLAGRVVAAERPNARFGGSAVARVGGHALAICRAYSNLVIESVTEREIDGVIGNYETDRRDLLREGTPNLEPTSLVAVAALASIVRSNPGETVAVIGTGQNAPLWPEPTPRPTHLLFQRNRR